MDFIVDTSTNLVHKAGHVNDTHAKVNLWEYYNTQHFKNLTYLKFTFNSEKNSWEEETEQNTVPIEERHRAAPIFVFVTLHSEHNKQYHGSSEAGDIRYLLISPFLWSVHL